MTIWYLLGAVIVLGMAIVTMLGGGSGTTFAPREPTGQPIGAGNGPEERDPHLPDCAGGERDQGHSPRDPAACLLEERQAASGPRVDRRWTRALEARQKCPDHGQMR